MLAFTIQPLQGMSTPAAIPEAGIAATVDEDELDDAFEAAAAFVVAVASSTKLNDEDALRIYGLYKQATEGACTSSRPGFWEQKKRRKWCGHICLAQTCPLCQIWMPTDTPLIRSGS